MKSRSLGEEWRNVAGVAMSGKLDHLEKKYPILLSSMARIFKNMTLKSVVENRKLQRLKPFQQSKVNKLVGFQELNMTCNLIYQCLLTLSAFEKHHNLSKVNGTTNPYFKLDERIKQAYEKFSELGVEKSHPTNRRFISDVLPAYEAIEVLRKVPPPLKKTRITPEPSPPKVKSPSKKDVLGTVLQNQPAVNNDHHYLDNDIQKLISIAKEIQTSSKQVTIKKCMFSYKEVLASKVQEISNATITVKADTRHWKDFLDCIKENPYMQDPSPINIDKIITNLEKINHELIGDKENIASVSGPRRAKRIK